MVAFEWALWQRLSMPGGGGGGDDDDIDLDTTEVILYLLLFKF